METSVVFWDVQHGHASYIKTPNEKHLVIDLGIGSFKEKTDFSPLLHLKNRYGVKQLDYVLITHPHLDHIDDILNFDSLSPKVFSRPRHLTKEQILKSVRETDRPKFDKYFEIDNRYTGTVESSNDISIPNNWGGLEVKQFWNSSCPTDNINNHSPILVTSFVGLKVVFPGDNEKCSFDAFMKDPSFISATKDADILLAPHHGRESGFHLEFVKNVNPRITVISDGRFCDTSATDRYSGLSRGWSVSKRSGGTETRKCLTTRSDGVINACLGRSGEGSRYISITID